MNITVILCTYNRSQRLSKALDSAAASEASPALEWEILVVDDNSRDQTRDVVEDFRRRHPGRFRYLLEPQPGKSPRTQRRGSRGSERCPGLHG